MIAIESFKQLDEMLSKPLVFIMFSAVWCGPCKTMKPLISQLEDEFRNICFLYIDIEKCPEAAAKYSIMHVPTFLLLKNNQIVEEASGVKSKQFLVDILSKFSKQDHNTI